MNKTFTGIMAGASIAMAGVLTLVLLLGLLFGQFQFNLSDAWTLVRGVLVLVFLIVSSRYFLTRSR